MESSKGARSSEPKSNPQHRGPHHLSNYLLREQALHQRNSTQKLMNSHYIAPFWDRQADGTKKLRSHPQEKHFTLTSEA